MEISVLIVSLHTWFLPSKASFLFLIKEYFIFEDLQFVERKKRADIIPILHVTPTVQFGSLEALGISLGYTPEPLQSRNSANSWKAPGSVSHWPRLWPGRPADKGARSCYSSLGWATACLQSFLEFLVDFACRRYKVFPWSVHTDQACFQRTLTCGWETN